MDTSEEQRLLHILRAAQGHPALLALVPLDLTFTDASLDERNRLKRALLAAAIPHWFDGPFLAALLAISTDEANDLIGKLQRLTNVEPFPARGQNACNVHEASRIALRQHLRTTQPDLWRTYSQHAHDYLASSNETHERIEALYHLFAADIEASVPACETLDRDLRQHPDTRAALCLTLEELKAEGWLTGAALVEAMRAPLWYRQTRGEISQLETEARTLLNLAQQHSNHFRIADAFRLLGDVHESHGVLDKAKECHYESLRLDRELTACDPTNAEWQRDLSISLDKIGNIATTEGNLDAALLFFSEAKSISERLASTNPANASWQRNLSVSLNKLGDLAVTQGDLDKARIFFSEAKAISEHLAASDLTNAVWQRDLSVSLEKLGDLAVAQGDLNSALLFLSEAKTISEHLAVRDPTNATWQRDLSLSLEKLGDLAVAQGDLKGALLFFSEAKVIFERLAASDPTNAVWQRDLSVSLEKLASLTVS